MELTDVPPEMTPTLKVVRGDSSATLSLKRASAAREQNDGIGHAEVAPGMPRRDREK